jgi:TetR/AcrR family transcriptional regulator, transcriptional repressor of bet genes
MQYYLGHHPTYTTMGRRPNTALRREQIVDALHAEVATVGFSRTTTKSIAERAGLAPGLVHYHFKDKEEILHALVERLIAQADARYDALSATAASPEDALRSYIIARVGEGAAAEAEQVSVWVALLGDAMAVPTVGVRLSTWLAHEQKHLAALFRAAGVGSPGAHAALLLSAVLGSFSLHTLRVAGVPRGYAAPQLRAWLENALGKLP